MSNTYNGGAAFPVSGLSGLPNDNFIHPQEGMTLRDYFAAAALTGLLASGHYTLLSDRGAPDYAMSFDEDNDNYKIAAVLDSQHMADAMLEARKEGA